MPAQAFLTEGPEQRLLSPNARISMMQLSFEISGFSGGENSILKGALMFVDMTWRASDLSLLLCLWVLISVVLKARSSVPPFSHQAQFSSICTLACYTDCELKKRKKANCLYFKTACRSIVLSLSVYFRISDKMLEGYCKLDVLHGELFLKYCTLGSQSQS